MSATQSNGIAAVVVTYNSAAEVAECLRAVAHLNEIVVVDNGSQDATRDIVRAVAPEARLIANDENRGFAAAVNQGVRATQSALTLLLNPDAVVVSLGGMAERCQRPQVGIVGGKLLGPDGCPQIGFFARSFPTAAALGFELLGINRLLPRNPVNRRYRNLGMNPDQPLLVDQPAGAFLMFRRDVFEHLGGFDEQFHPLWYEDVDFCLRTRQAGYEIWYEPSAEARHQGAHSLRSLAVQDRHAAWYGNLLRFGDKHFSPPARMWLRFAALLGVSARWLASWFGSRKVEERRSYQQVLRLIFRTGFFSVRPAEMDVQPHGVE